MLDGMRRQRAVTYVFDKVSQASSISSGAFCDVGGVMYICVVSWRESFKILAIALASATFWDFTPMLYPATTTGADS